MSQNTYDGFLVSLKATLELMQFLNEKCDFDYLMTARLNQDALEVIYMHIFLVIFYQLSKFFNKFVFDILGIFWYG